MYQQAKPAILWAFILSLGCIGQVSASPYSFHLDSFSVNGNSPGNSTDDFDDGVLAPWSVADPTATESGGQVTLTNPGNTSLESFGSPLQFITERSYIEDDPAFDVANGAGDFSAESVWLSGIPGINQFHGMVLSEHGTGTDLISVHLYNFDNTLANVFGVPVGMGAFAYNEVSGILAGISLNPADLTGDVHLSVSFTDATDSFSASVSLDSGNTTQSILSPTAVTWNGTADWGLGGESWEQVPLPATLPLMLAGLLGFGFAAKHRG